MMHCHALLSSLWIVASRLFLPSPSFIVSFLHQIPFFPSPHPSPLPCPVHALSKLPYGKLDSKSLRVSSGVVFLTYASLLASQAQDSRRSRLQQVVQWAGGAEFQGLLVLDEVSQGRGMR